MKNSIVLAIAGGIAVVLSGFSVGGYVIYRASVHEQNCLSYERQMDSSLNEGVTLIDDLATMKRNLEMNPIMAFAYLGKIGDVQMKSEAFRRGMNDVGYAYRETCGFDRKKKFFNRSENKTRLDHIINVAGSIQ